MLTTLTSNIKLPFDFIQYTSIVDNNIDITKGFLTLLV